MDPLLLRSALQEAKLNRNLPKAIIPVHLYGMPAKMNEINAIAEEYGVAVIEDAAEALGSKLNDKPCGSLGNFGVLSFNGNKIITTSGGGAIVTKNKEVLDTAMKFAQARLSPPSFAQILGEAAVDLPDNYFDTTKAEYKRRRDTIVTRLNSIKGVFCPNPGGAFYAMVRLPIDDSDKFCQWLLESFSYNGQTIMLAPAGGFYSTPGLGKNEVRLAYVLNVTAINAAMDCLEKALEEYPGKVSI
jgi:DNA-binding transcriptional MocR family regulator